jgi:hypothetical protein
MRQQIRQRHSEEVQPKKIQRVFTINLPFSTSHEQVMLVVLSLQYAFFCCTMVSCYQSNIFRNFPGCNARNQRRIKDWYQQYDYHTSHQNKDKHKHRHQQQSSPLKFHPYDNIAADNSMKKLDAIGFASRCKLHSYSNHWQQQDESIRLTQQQKSKTSTSLHAVIQPDDLITTASSNNMGLILIEIIGIGTIGGIIQQFLQVLLSNNSQLQNQRTTLERSIDEQRDDLSSKNDLATVRILKEFFFFYFFPTLIRHNSALFPIVHTYNNTNSKKQPTTTPNTNHYHIVLKWFNAQPP